VKGVLNTAANISKMLYPDVRDRARRGDPRTGAGAEFHRIRSSRKDALHQALGAALTATFAHQCRTVRNDLEHLDDRIDRWVLTSATGGSVSLEGPGIQPLRHAEDTGHLFFSFDHQALVVYFGAHRVELRPLIEGFERLLEASIRARHRATMDGEEPWEEMVRAEFLMEPVSRRWA